MNELLTAILSTGGAGFLWVIIKGIKLFLDTRNSSQQDIIRRINEDAKQAHEDADMQRERAKRAESELDSMRSTKDIALEKAAEYRLKLIANGITPDEKPIQDPNNL